MYPDRLQTICLSFQEICQGHDPWIPLGNFLNDWYAYQVARREDLVVDPLPQNYPADLHQWAAFCAASVDYLCEQYDVSCPSWVHHPDYQLSTPWYYSPGAHKSQVRERLRQRTPEPFIRRNIFCGNRMFQNKWEALEQHRQRTA